MTLVRGQSVINLLSTHGIIYTFLLIETPPPPTPHIIPTNLRVTETSVDVGDRNTINIDVTVDFDPSSDPVDGTNNWRVIVWLSNEDDGVSGSRVQETDQTISAAQRDQSLRPGRPLNFRVNPDSMLK